MRFIYWTQNKGFESWKSIFEQMRIKSFFVVSTSLVFFFWCLITFRSQYRASVQSLVSKTRKHTRTWKRFNNSINEEDEKLLNVDEKYLLPLGFTDNPRLYPHNVWTNTTLPVIVTTLFAGDEKLGISFAKNIAHMASNHTALLYNVGLSWSELQTVTAHCNTTQCQIVPFNIKLFPSHVENDPVKTVKALVIQDALNKAGGVLYLDNKFHIMSYIDPLFKKKPIGCFRRSKQAVSTLTHPNMLVYFRARVEDFQFLPMVDTNRLLLWNTIEVHSLVMLPWVQCVLTSECVSPIGAQSQGCRFNKKPQYRYSGCHDYDTSAFNIVLGVLYQFHDSIYTFPVDDRFFTVAASTENQTLS